ncbi:MAG: flagellin lysine-N-methylase [Clostridia bacterium]|nr:flagellin lysine-N-methylase [Clostridia bacterium]
MKIRVPEYFIDFRCIADKCKDSCCIGWEIDIDERTRAKYEALDTPLGREICEKTSHGCFPLSKNGRCSFLDERGLCRIISALGDGYLCDICREHPRYYGVYKGGYEGGLGLGCEEAARMILSLRSMPKFTEIERDIPYSDEDDFAELSDTLRKNLYNRIFELSIPELIGKYLAYASAADEVAFEASASGKAVAIPKVTYAPAECEETGEIYKAFLDALSDCEALTDDWDTLMEKLEDIDAEDILRKEKALRPLLFYFTHRYVRDGILDMSLGARVLFALGSALAVTALSEVIGVDEPEARAVVLYSKNIEYSTDNVDMILDGLSEFL